MVISSGALFGSAISSAGFILLRKRPSQLAFHYWSDAQVLRGATVAKTSLGTCGAVAVGRRAFRLLPLHRLAICQGQEAGGRGQARRSTLLLSGRVAQRVRRRAQVACRA